MLPGDGELSTKPVPTRFMGARALAGSKTLDYEDGGVALNDPSRGLLYQRWVARIYNAGTALSRVTLAAPNTPEFVWITRPYLTEISFTFDANMRPVVAMVAGGTALLNWFSSADGVYEDIVLPAGAITPRVSLDDKRYIGSSAMSLSDVILSYVLDGVLVSRYQRERFIDSHVIAEGVKPLIRTGMNRGLRFQWMSEV